MPTRPAALPALEIVAHRGASADAPENTLPAIELAWRQQADAVEIDVQVTKDGRLVAIHDATTERTTGQSGVVRNQTLSELQQLDAGAWKDPKFSNIRIPTLQEVLAVVPAEKRLFVELKCGVAGLPDLERTLSESNLRGTRIVLISFSLPLLRLTRQTMPHIPAYWVWDLTDTQVAERRQLPLRLLGLARRAGVQGLDLSNCDLLDVSFADSVRNSGLHLGVWTVDDLPSARRLSGIGIDSLTTNRPGWLRQQLQFGEDGRACVTPETADQ